MLEFITGILSLIVFIWFVASVFVSRYDISELKKELGKNKECNRCMGIFRSYANMTEVKGYGWYSDPTKYRTYYFCVNCPPEYDEVRRVNFYRSGKWERVYYKNGKIVKI